MTYECLLILIRLKHINSSVAINSNIKKSIIGFSVIINPNTLKRISVK